MSAEDDVQPFEINEWGKEKGLNPKTLKALTKEDFTEEDLLKEVTPADVAALQITIGQSRALKIALEELGNLHFKEKSAAPTSTVGGREEARETTTDQDGTKQADSNQQILQAGEEYEKLWGRGAIQELVGKTAGGTEGAVSAVYMPDVPYDPTMLLTVRSTREKALQVASFVTEDVRERLAQRKKDSVRVEEGPNGELLFKTDQQGLPKLTLSEWGAANMRLLGHMLDEGHIMLKSVPDYLAYTATIFDFVAKFDWHSILDYDFRYREQQKRHKFRWGSSASTLCTAALAQRTKPPPPPPTGGAKHGGGRNRGGGKPRPAPGSINEACKAFQATGGCSYGDKCIFLHTSKE